jgi:hypothetical protein
VAFLFTSKKNTTKKMAKRKRKILGFFNKIKKFHPVGMVVGAIQKGRERRRLRRAASEGESEPLASKFGAQASIPMGGSGAAQINQNQGEGSATVDALGTVEKVAGLVKGDPSPDERGGNNDASGADPKEKKPFYKTPIGIAAIAGGALLLIGGIYMATKKK